MIRHLQTAGFSAEVVALPAAFDILGNPWVLTASGIMVVAEFLADKVPGFDSIWDGVHTFIRIPAGAVLAGAAAGPADPVLVAVAVILGGAIASGAHIAKAGTRALINTSPEPFSNWIASVGEDVAVVAGVWASINHPVFFLIALVLFVILMIWLLPRIWVGVKKVFRLILGWFRKEESPTNLNLPQ